MAPCAAGFTFASAYALDLSQSAMFLTWHVRPAGPRTGSLAASSAGSSVGAGGFLMTGHEVGAALGVAVLSAVASTAGSLASLERVAAGCSRGLFAGGTYAMTYAARTVPRAGRRPGAAGQLEPRTVHPDAITGKPGRETRRFDRGDQPPEQRG